MIEGNYWTGIDISKKQLDWQVNDTRNHQLGFGKVQNTPRGITGLLEKWTRQGIPLEQMVICFEHTGSYGLLLAAMLEQAGVGYVAISAAQLQRSLGIRRGKTDSMDAGRLAEYGWRFRDRLQPSRLPSGALLELRSWLMWRERLVKMRAGLANALQANELTGQVIDLEELIGQMQGQHDQLTEQLKQTDRRIKALVRTHESLRGQYELLVSIPGIGPVIAGWLLVYTEGFTRFENGRKLACFVGSAPYPNRSGTHKGPDRVSRWRCVRLKTLLLNGVNSAIQYDPELRAYYQRKCGEGKHPMSVKNAVVCKLIYRVFAVVNRGTPYVKIYEHQMSECP